MDLTFQFQVVNLTHQQHPFNKSSVTANQEIIRAIKINKEIENVVL